MTESLLGLFFGEGSPTFGALFCQVLFYVCCCLDSLAVFKQAGVVWRHLAVHLPSAMRGHEFYLPLIMATCLFLENVEPTMQQLSRISHVSGLNKRIANQIAVWFYRTSSYEFWPLLALYLICDGSCSKRCTTPGSPLLKLKLSLRPHTPYTTDRTHTGSRVS